MAATSWCLLLWEGVSRRGAGRGGRRLHPAGFCSSSRWGDDATFSLLFSSSYPRLMAGTLGELSVASSRVGASWEGQGSGEGEGWKMKARGWRG